jgi:tetratricopeptide (TPR) repeat protein
VNPGVTRTDTLVARCAHVHSTEILGTPSRTVVVRMSPPSLALPAVDTLLNQQVMTTDALALKQEGNLHFARGEYAAAIASYEAAICGKAKPTVRLVLFTNRLNAYNRSGSDNNQARNDLLDFLRHYGSDDWTQSFGNRKLCKAYFHLSKSYELQNNIATASDMLQACLSFEPSDRDVLKAWDRVQRDAMKEMVRLGWFKDGSAAGLSIEGETCSHCLEELEPAALCVQYCCKHGFHESCAMSWLLHEGTGEHEGAGDRQLVKGVPKMTCPLCRANVIG